MTKFLFSLLKSFMTSGWEWLSAVIEGAVKGLFSAWVKAKNEPHKVEYHEANQERVDSIGAVIESQRDELYRESQEARDAQKPKSANDLDGAG